MFLDELQLKNFRNYQNLKIKFSPFINIIYGNNAQGKTNLLESIYILGLTKSHLCTMDDKLIKEGTSFSLIKGTINNNKLKTKLEITLMEKNKLLKIDKKEIRKVNDYINNSLNIIVFYPEDLEIIKGSPNKRRDFIDVELSQLSNNYLKILNEYNKLLKIRNEYLKRLSKHEKIDNNYFQIITNYLVDKGILIYRMRMKFINKLNETCGKIFHEISNKNQFYLNYIPNFIFNENIKEGFITKLNENLSIEIKNGATLYGPHRDEIEFLLENKNLKYYGSQGQKRMAIIATKLAEIEIFKEFKECKPILLLDDIFSELDNQKKNSIIKYISNKTQVIITTTDIRKINKNKFEHAYLFKIKDGEIIKTEEVDNYE